MSLEQLAAYRQSRLSDLLKHPDFGGKKAVLGRALGFKDGAYVRQMIEGERPITEKLVQKIEVIRDGKFAGWFSAQAPQPEPAMPDIRDPANAVVRIMAQLTPENRQRVLQFAATLLPMPATTD